jgi:hypothetical protein
MTQHYLVSFTFKQEDGWGFGNCFVSHTRALTRKVVTALAADMKKEGEVDNIYILNIIPLEYTPDNGSEEANDKTLTTGVRGTIKYYLTQPKRELETLEHEQHFPGRTKEIARIDEALAWLAQQPQREEVEA